MELRSPIILDGNLKREYDPFQDCIPSIEMSGRYRVEVGEDYIVKKDYQSIVKESVDLSGNLILEGQLFIEV